MRLDEVPDSEHKFWRVRTYLDHAEALRAAGLADYGSGAGVRREVEVGERSLAVKVDDELDRLAVADVEHARCPDRYLADVEPAALAASLEAVGEGYLVWRSARGAVGSLLVAGRLRGRERRSRRVSASSVYPCPVGLRRHKRNGHDEGQHGRGGR